MLSLKLVFISLLIVNIVLLPATEAAKKIKKKSLAKSKTKLKLKSSLKKTTAAKAVKGLLPAKSAAKKVKKKSATKSKSTTKSTTTSTTTSKPRTSAKIESSSNETLTARIVGGHRTTISAIPYLVNLRSNGAFYCGGTLVNRNFVVTAAHCVKGQSKSGLTVVGGSTRLSTGGVSRTVSKIFVPKAFNLRSLNKDVAILKLSSPMTGTNIKPIRLCNKRWKTGDMVKVSGWGLTRANNKNVPDVVETVNVPIIGRISCARSYRGAATLTNSMFCASVPGVKDACSGDSGGPVIYNNRLCGIVSWGIGCASRNYPGVYTNVRRVMKFIKRALKN